MQLILQVQVKSLKNLNLYMTIMNLAESKDDALNGSVLHVLRAPGHQEDAFLHRETVLYNLVRKSFV